MAFTLSNRRRGARMYDAASSRWNGVDALAESQSAITTYHYAYNSPLIFTDPSGLAPVYRNGEYVDDQDENKKYTWDEVMDYLNKSGGIIATLKPNTVYSNFDTSPGHRGSSFIPSLSDQRKIELQIERIYSDNCINLNVEHIDEVTFASLKGMEGMQQKLRKLNVALLNFTPIGLGLEGTTGMTKYGDQALSQVHISEIVFGYIDVYKVGLQRGTSAWQNYLDALAHIAAHELYHLYRMRGSLLSGSEGASAFSLASSHSNAFNLMANGAISLPVFIPGRTENTSANKKALNTFASEHHFFLISTLFDYHNR